jgi:hypothetical protein
MKNTEDKPVVSASAKESVLPQDVAAQYSPRKGLVQQFSCAEYGIVDLSKINLKFAKKLAEKGYLIKQSGSNSV